MTWNPMTLYATMLVLAACAVLLVAVKSRNQKQSGNYSQTTIKLFDGVAILLLVGISAIILAGASTNWFGLLRPFGVETSGVSTSVPGVPPPASTPAG